MPTIEWLGHDAFRIGDGTTIYIDPWEIAGGPPADLVLVTHDHYDHCSPDDIAKVASARTVIVAAAPAAGKLKGQVHAVRPGDRLDVGGVHIEVVAAYNVNKFRSPGAPFHPKEAGGVGFVVEVGGERIYHAGDTDLTPEMARVRCTIALVPVSGKYVMTADEAAEAVKQLKPRVAIPMHYGAIVGSAADAERLRRLCPDVEVRVLPKS